ncbi:MAG: DUF2848 domain-containing protein [Rhodospirillaceae bacterium]|nr:DUF2848 domain-containing protein [Rhodospirillaceae bacterium]
MAGARLAFQCIDRGGSGLRRVRVDHLVIAGWTGRNRAAMEAHIEELAALGVKRPAATPIFYRVAAAALTADDVIEVSGAMTSGEVEPVLVALDDGLWVGIGSDHTDRTAETVGVALSKQLCPKPIAPVLWRFSEIADHWDSIELRAHAVIDGKRRVYQEGKASIMRRPEDLIERYAGSGEAFGPGGAMFCGTMAVKGGIAPADRFEIEMHDSTLGRTIAHAYAIVTLPVVG